MYFFIVQYHLLIDNSKANYIKRVYKTDIVNSTFKRGWTNCILLINVFMLLNDMNEYKINITPQIDKTTPMKFENGISSQYYKGAVY